MSIINNSINNTSYGITVLGTALINQTGSGASTIGNSSAGAVVIASGSASSITIANQSLAINTGTGALNISNDAAATTVHIATGAGAKALTLGSTNTTSSVTFNTGSGGINIPSFTTTGALVSNASGLITDADASTAGYVLTSNGSGSAPSFAALPSSLLPWTDVTGATVTLAANNGYVMNHGATLITATLPTTAAFGTVINIQGFGSGLWTIAQNSGQVIHYGSANTTTGVTGSLSSTLQYDNVELLCVVADTEWVVVSGNIGNLTVA